MRKNCHNSWKMWTTSMNEDNTLTGRTVLAEAALLLIKLHVKGQSTPLYITSSTPQKLLQAGFPNN
jgi:hypothetical protein